MPGSWNELRGLVLPYLPWLPLALALLGLLPIAWGLWRRRLSRPTCPKCKYDMSGAVDRPCPECGHGVKRERDLYRWPRRWRWVSLGLLIALVIAPYSDFVWHRAFYYQEPVWTATVPTTAMIVGYSYLTPTWRETLDKRLVDWHQAGFRNLAAAVYPHRARVRAFLLEGTAGVAEHRLDLIRHGWDWQAWLLARTAYRWWDHHSQQVPPNSGTKQHIVLHYMREAASQSDATSYERLLTYREQHGAPPPYFGIEPVSAGLRSTRPAFARFAPRLEAELRRTVAHPPATPPNYKGRYDGTTAITRGLAKVGPPGIDIAKTLLHEDGIKLRVAGLKILDAAAYVDPETIDLALGLGEDIPWNQTYHLPDYFAQAGISAVPDIRQRLTDSDPARQALAIRALGYVFFKSPLYTIFPGKGNTRADSVRQEWADRTTHASYGDVLARIKELADSGDPLVQPLARQFIDYDREFGSRAKRLEITATYDKLRRLPFQPF